MALDRTNQRLIVDQKQGELLILDANSGASLASVSLPSHAEHRHPAPQVDPQTGLIFAFRDKTIHVIDPATAVVAQTVELSVKGSNCGVEGIVPIIDSQYDLVQQKLYLSFFTWACTPWVGTTIIAYDGHNLTELGRYETDALSYHSVPYQGSLFGATRPRLQAGVYWAWNNDDVWFEKSEQPNSLQGIVADWGRQLVYEALSGRIHVVAATTRQRLSEVEVPLLTDDYQARLTGHDPITDQLYFLTGGRLHIWPADNLFQASQQPTPAASGLPPRAVLSLSVSPAWPADKTLVGLWQKPNCLPGDGVIHILNGGEDDWRPALAEATGQDSCGAIATVALSPSFAQDGVIFAAAKFGNTIFKSSDGGRSWQSDSVALPSWVQVDRFFLSSGYAQDQTVFAHTVSGTVFALNLNGDFHRSLDGGLTWELIMSTADVNPTQIVYGPDMEENRPVFLLHGTELHASYDGGTSIWSGGPGSKLSAVPTTLAVSSSFVNDGLLFVGTADGQVITVDASRP